MEEEEGKKYLNMHRGSWSFPTPSLPPLGLKGDPKGCGRGRWRKEKGRGLEEKPILQGQEKLKANFPPGIGAKV